MISVPQAQPETAGDKPNSIEFQNLETLPCLTLRNLCFPEKYLCVCMLYYLNYFKIPKNYKDHLCNLVYVI